MQKIHTWLSRCEETHDYCTDTSLRMGTFFPTRIIDVQRAGIGIVTLRYRDEVETPRLGVEKHVEGKLYPHYWTLSHRWSDPDEFLQLRQDTEHLLRGGVDLNNFSRTFCDAMLLVFRLGYRYIWIDSLCILQGSPDDWQKEASTMVDVYRHTFCNISATAAAEDPSGGGLFRPRIPCPRNYLYPFEVDVQIDTVVHGNLSGPWMIWNDSIWGQHVEHRLLNGRGWVMQERFLSPRTMHFTEAQIYWECLNGQLAEIDPEDKLNLQLESMSETVLGHKASRVMLIQMQKELGFPGQRQGDLFHARKDFPYHHHWTKCVEDYTACKLTKESDRLVAISGIVKAFRHATGDRYLAGLWESTISFDLGWQCHGSDEEGSSVLRSQSYAPSWSWASVVGERNVTTAPDSGLETSLIRFIGARITPDPPEGGDPDGLLLAAELDIECSIYYFLWEGARKPFTTEKFSTYYDQAKTQPYYFARTRPRESLFLDTSDIVRQFTEAGKVEGICTLLWMGSIAKFLLLKRDRDDKYRRIGVFRTDYIGSKLTGKVHNPRSRITLI